MTLQYKLKIKYTHDDSATRILKTPKSSTSYFGWRSKMTVCKKPFRRLSQCVIPSNYRICTKIDFDEKEFSGTCNIELSIGEETQRIEFHSVDLELTKIKFVSSGQVEYKCIKQESDSNLETVTAVFDSPIPKSHGVFHVNFKGKLLKQLYGLYYCAYNTCNGEEKLVACTQFESTFARKAFPCWDEPAIKATFKISLIVPKSMVALSNMEIVSTNDYADPGYHIVTYAETPKMSTYLVAYVVGDLECISSKTCDGKSVSVYTPIGKKEHGRFSLDIATKAIPFYENYFDIEYPIPKADLVAIPEFAAGAMENWGLTTYRETALLVDPENSSASGKQRVALVVAHELAHQWFGNIVTMEWWTHLWLNEGFATWIEFLLVNEFFPSYDIWTQFVSTDYARCLELDSLDNSHPVEVEVGHPSEIDEIFDAISYSKGSCVIRMLHEYIGKDAFQKGLQNYLKDFRYRNASTSDLWKHLADASGKPVVEVMGCWTKITGYPVLCVSTTNAFNDGKIEVTIKQCRFVVSATNVKESSCWMIPITVCVDYQDEPVATILMNKEETTITLELAQKPKWIKLNKNQVGLYRVNYSPEMLEPLLKAFSSKEICATERLGIQSDIFSLSKLGLVDAITYFNVFLSCYDEDNYTVWSDIINNLSTLRCYVQCIDDSCGNNDGKLEKCFDAMICKVFEGLLHKLGWESSNADDHLGNMLRSSVISMLGNANHREVVDEARKRFKNHCDKSIPLSPDLRGPIYSIVMKFGGQQEFDTLQKMYNESMLQEEKVKILSVLGRCKNTKVARQVLDFSLTVCVPSCDAIYGIMGFGSSLEARKERWDYIKTNWSVISGKYNNGGFLLNRLVGGCISSFSTHPIIQDITDFFDKNPTPAIERTLKQSLEEIRVNAHWIEMHSKHLEEFLCEKFK